MDCGRIPSKGREIYWGLEERNGVLVVIGWPSILEREGNLRYRIGIWMAISLIDCDLRADYQIGLIYLHLRIPPPPLMTRHLYSCNVINDWFACNPTSTIINGLSWERRRNSKAFIFFVERAFLGGKDRTIWFCFWLQQQQKQPAVGSHNMRADWHAKPDIIKWHRMKLSKDIDWSSHSEGH